MNFFKKFHKLDLKNKKDKKKLISFCITVLGTFMLIVGTSSAFLLFRAEGSTNTISAGTLALTLPTEGNSLSLVNAVPLPDELGIKQTTSYDFVLSSTSTIETYYEIRLINDCNTTESMIIGGETITPNICLPSQYVKAGIKINNGEYEIKTIGENDLLLSGYISNSSQQINISIILWLDENTPNQYQGIINEVSQNVVFTAKMQLYARQLIEGEKKFTYTGNYQEYTALQDGYYQIEAYGSRGANFGGKGGYTSGKVYLKVGETLYVYVGETKELLNQESFNGGVGGANGYPGGGASDIRCFYNFSTEKCEKNLINLNWSDDLGLNSRIMVAGGGGSSNSTGIGGAGGNLIAGNSISGDMATGGTQISGGTGALGNGSFGIGGANCGGGGGYYGGGTANCFGGGGSSYISGHLGSIAISSFDLTNNPRTVRNDSVGNICTATSALSDIVCSYHYSEKIFTDTVMQSGINNSNGYVIIKYFGPTLN